MVALMGALKVEDLVASSVVALAGLSADYWVGEKADT